MKTLKTMVFALLMSTAPSFAQSVLSPLPASTAQQWTPQSIRALLQPLVDGKRAVGISVGIISPQGQVVASVGNMAEPGVAGVVGVAGTAEVNANTLFEIGSITKAFTGTLLADLVARKVIGLDDPIGPALQALATRENHAELKANTALAAVTWRQLATHSAGIPRMPMTQMAMMKAMLANPENPYAGYSKADFLDYFGGLTPKSNAPYEYSNSGAALQGLLLAQVAGTPYSQLLQERLLNPLVMGDTYLDVPDRAKPRFAVGHDGKGKATSHWDMGIFAPAGGIKSSVNDLLKLAQASLAGNPTLRFAQTQLNATGKAGGVGMNWHMMRITQVADPKTLDTMVWHNGATFGATSFLGIDAGRGFAVVVLINSGVPPLADQIAQHLWDQRLPAPSSQQVSGMSGMQWVFSAVIAWAGIGVALCSRATQLAARLPVGLPQSSPVQRSRVSALFSAMKKPFPSKADALVDSMFAIAAAGFLLKFVPAVHLPPVLGGVSIGTVWLCVLLALGCYAMFCAKWLPSVLPGFKAKAGLFVRLAVLGLLVWLAV